MKKPQNNGTKNQKKNIAFRSFAEYWHLTKKLNEYHRMQLLESMSQSEHDSLLNSFEDGGWRFLFLRNSCDETLDEIKKETGIDLIAIRIKVLNGHPQLVHKSFWQHVTNCFEGIPWEHVVYIFDGLRVDDFDNDYLKVSRHVPVQ